MAVYNHIIKGACVAQQNNTYQKAVDLLLKNKEGITTKEYFELGGFKSKSAMFSAIHYYNIKKDSPYIIKNVDGYYKIFEKKPKSQFVPNIKTQNNTTSVQIKQKDSSIDDIIPISVRSDLKLINPADMPDVLDLLKKAYFYQASAEALIRSSKVTNMIKQAF